MQDSMQTLFAEAEANGEHGFGYPAHVKREIERLTSCGVLAAGLARVQCTKPGCTLERLVAYSCKGRSLCPSCVARRMADDAAHLVDHVLPRAPYRQWTLSLPYAIRYRVAYNRALFCSSLVGVLAHRLRLATPSRPMRGATRLTMAMSNACFCASRAASTRSPRWKTFAKMVPSW